MTKPSTKNVSTGDTQLKELSEEQFLQCGKFDPSARVTVALEYSNINFKDAMALCGRPGILAHDSMIAGIDGAGRVVSDSTELFREGERVIFTGSGHGERFNGGFASRAIVNGEFLHRIPQVFSLKQAAALGTAGVTAMLSVLELEACHITPESGPIAVTGATGGVGSFSVMLLAARGYSVTAYTSRIGTHGAFLENLGATDIRDRRTLEEHHKPLDSALFAGAIDTLGGQNLASLISHIQPRGLVAACGIAADTHLKTSVLPFILRGIRLVGINSVNVQHAERELIWARLAVDISRQKLDELTNTIPLEQCLEISTKILAGEHSGKTVVSLS